MPAAIGRPPSMIKQQESFPFRTEAETPYYYNLKRIQENVSNVYPSFPMQANKDFFVSKYLNYQSDWSNCLSLQDNKFERIIKTSATQIEYLFDKLQQKTNTSPLQQIFATADGVAATASFNVPSAPSS